MKKIFNKNIEVITLNTFMSFLWISQVSPMIEDDRMPFVSNFSLARARNADLTKNKIGSRTASIILTATSVSAKLYEANTQQNEGDAYDCVIGGSLTKKQPCKQGDLNQHGVLYHRNLIRLKSS